MLFGVRVEMAPIEPRDDGPERARVVQLSLTTLGTAPTTIVEGVSAARITFHATGIRKVRDPEETEAKVGSLAGKLDYDRERGQPQFLIAPDAELELEQPLEVDAPGSKAPRKKRRAFELAFDPESFPVPLQDGQLLLLPDAVVDGARFLELRAELEVLGASESSKDVSAVLGTPFTEDSPIPIVPEPIRIAIRDHLDQPQPGVSYQLELDGQVFDEVTDGDGFTQPHDVRGTTGKLTVLDQVYDLSFVDEVSDDFSELQGILNALGYRAGELTGSMNRPTEDAIQAFQRKEGLAVSGRFDGPTRLKLQQKYDLGSLTEDSDDD